MNSTSPAREVGDDADQIARLLDRRARRRADRHAHLVARSRRRAWSCRGPADRAAARDRAARRAAWRRRSRPAGSRGSRSWPMYSSSRRGRSPASYCASSSTRAARRRCDRRRHFGHVRRNACFSSALEARRRRPTSSVLRSRLNGFFGERPMIPQVHQRREQIVAHAAAPPAAPPPAPAAAACARGSRSFSSSTMRSDVFLPTPGIAVSRAESPRSIARTSSVRLDARQHRQRQLRADAADADQALEQFLLEHASQSRRAASASSRTCV